MAYAVELPDAWDDPDYRRVAFGSFPNKREAINFVRKELDGDSGGKIPLIRKIEGDYFIDLPNLHDLNFPVPIETFKRKRDAIKYVKKVFGGDAEGRIQAVVEI